MIVYREKGLWLVLFMIALFYIYQMNRWPKDDWILKAGNLVFFFFQGQSSTLDNN